MLHRPGSTLTAFVGPPATTIAEPSNGLYRRRQGIAGALYNRFLFVLDFRRPFDLTGNFAGVLTQYRCKAAGTAN